MKENFKDVIIGIDNGKQGGVVVLSPEGEVLYKCVMPLIGTEYDTRQLVKVLSVWQPRLVVLEKVFTMPTIPRGTAMSLGWCLGLMEGICNALGFPYKVVAAKEWQKTVLKDMDRTKTKEASKLFISKRFPGEDWRATERSVKLHDGLTDAACLALYGSGLTF